jgi:DNA-binding transcriptional regulator YdaS (Cro superfamily)
MTTDEAIKHFGSGEALRKQIGVTSGAISQWGEFPPENRQLQIERITLGALKAEPGCMDKVLGMDKISHV